MTPYSNNRGINIEWVKSNHTYLMLEIFLLNSRIKKYVPVNKHRYILLASVSPVDLLRVEKRKCLPLYRSLQAKKRQ